MSFFREQPHGQHRARRQISERTMMRRAPHGCTDEEVREMKTMRDGERMTFDAIAEWMGKTEEEVKLALAPTRSPNPRSGRAVINTTPENLARLRSRALPCETAGQAFERLLIEHEHFEQLLGR